MKFKDNPALGVLVILTILTVAYALFDLRTAKGEERSIATTSPSKVKWLQHEWVDQEGNKVNLQYVEIKASIKEACAKEGDSAWQEVVENTAKKWIEEHMESENLKGVDLRLGIPDLPCNIMGADDMLTFAIARTRPVEQ